MNVNRLYEYEKALSRLANTSRVCASQYAPRFESKQYQRDEKAPTNQPAGIYRRVQSGQGCWPLCWPLMFPVKMAGAAPTGSVKSQPIFSLLSSYFAPLLCSDATGTLGFRGASADSSYRCSGTLPPPPPNHAEPEHLTSFLFASVLFNFSLFPCLLFPSSSSDFPTTRFDPLRINCPRGNRRNLASRQRRTVMRRCRKLPLG